jgi:hypothetical protein
MQFWDTQTGNLILNLPRPLGLQVIFSPDGKSLALSHDDGRIHLLPIEMVLPKAIAVEPGGLQLSTWGRIKENALFQNYPNPFNPETWMPYQLVVPSPVRIHIYDLTGHRVRTLDLGQRQAGAYLGRNRAAYWDGRDNLGQPVAAGIYFYRLEAGDFTATRRMVLVK